MFLKLSDKALESYHMNLSNQIYYWAHMLDEAMCDKTLILEDREGKNINRAEKWIKANHQEVIGQQLENGMTITPRLLTQEIRNTMPNVRLADCKFLVGVTRLYFDNQTNPDIQSVFNKLNKMLKIICSKTHVDEYDNNLNGMSFDELDKRFSGAVQKELDNDRDEIDKLVLLKRSDYDIIAINSFEQARKYGKYVSWCITHHKSAFDSYTKNGLGRFYFCLKPGFQKIRKRAGDDCPMDDYGKSMIAISVNDDGSLNTCNCRWNRDNDGNDNMMDTKEISEFFGVNFYKTFKPYSHDELIEKYKSLQYGEDAISKKLGFIRCKDYEYSTKTCTKYFYISEVDGKIIKYYSCSIDGHIIFNGRVMHLDNDRLIDGISESITKIDDHAFMFCTTLNQIVIPSSITIIGREAFHACRKLQSIIIPNSVTTIGKAAFADCFNLKSVIIPNSITTIDEATFAFCRKLTALIIPDSVTIIGSYAFYDCSSLTSITIPMSVTSIGYNAFTNCTKLTSVIFENPNFKQMENYPWGVKDESIFKVK